MQKTKDFLQWMNILFNIVEHVINLTLIRKSINTLSFPQTELLALVLSYRILGIAATCNYSRKFLKQFSTIKHRERDKEKEKNL